MLTERMQHFVFPASTLISGSISPDPPGPFQNGLSFQVDLDAPFRLHSVVVWNLGVPQANGTEGQIALRIYCSDGRAIQRQLTSSNLLFPGNQYNQTGLSSTKALACTIRPSVLYPAGSTVTVDIIGLSTGIILPPGCVIVFVGCNIYQRGAVWAPEYPAKWKPQPYLDNLTVQSLAIPSGFPLLNQAFTAQADSDFVWQAGVYTDLGGSDDINQLVDLGVIVRDPSYKAYSNGYVPVGLLFPFLSAQAPGWLFPEIYIPRLGQIYFDFNYLYPGFAPATSPVTFTLGLKGMKVYAQ